MERDTTPMYIYSNFNMGTNPLVQGLGSQITAQFIGFEAVERFLCNFHFINCTIEIRTG